MWVSSLVVTLSNSSANSTEVVAALRAIPALTLGDSIGCRIPIVVEADAQDSRHWHDWIANLPGIAHVAVAFVSFEETLAAQEGQVGDYYV